MDWFIALLIVGIGFVLASGRSTWLVDYAVLVFVLNRGLRRIVDFYINHAFNPFSPISLTPLLLAGAMIYGVMLGHSRLPRWAQSIFTCLGCAVGYAFVIGFYHLSVAAVYALAEVLAPLSLAAYVMALNPKESVRDRWVRSFSWGAILASGYGWYQYMTIPPWDEFWLRAVGFVGYMGVPEPTKMSCFSTMAERGPLAAYLGFSVVPMIVSSKWRTFLSWPAVVLVFSVILLTASRGGLMIALLATTVFVLVNRGAKTGQVMLATLIVGTAAWFGMERIPNAEVVTSRFSTLGNIRTDGSYQGRVAIMSYGPGTILRNPLGTGLGSSGLGTRITGGGGPSAAMISDAGYFQILLVYGIIGTGLLIRGLYLAWKRLEIYHNIRELRSDHVLLARALMVATLLACWLGDMFSGFSIFWLALGCGLAVRPERLARVLLKSQAEASGAAENKLIGEGAQLDGGTAASEESHGLA